MESSQSQQKSGPDKSRSKKPRSVSTLDTLKECQGALASAREKAERSAEKLAGAMSSRTTLLGDTALQDAKKGFMELKNTQERLFNFTQERMMKCYFGDQESVRKCERDHVTKCVRTYMTAQNTDEALEQPSVAYTPEATLVTIVIAGTARKKESTYVPPQAVIRVQYQPSLSATYNNFDHVRVPYGYAARVFPDSARYVMVDEYHAPPTEGIPLTSNDERKVVRAFKPAVATSTLFMQMCPEVAHGKKYDISDIPLGNELINLNDYVTFMNTCLNSKTVTIPDNVYERDYLFHSFQCFLLNRVSVILSSIHRRVQEDNVDDYECHYISPSFLQLVWPGFASVSDALAVASDHFQGKRRRLPPLRRSAKTRLTAPPSIDHDDQDDDEHDDDDE